MPHNNYFQFKQFRVEQNLAAMRVGTDGVLLGAWANVEGNNSILDIGTGTGVIALMLAQRSNANIDAIDIESGAIQDAIFNFKQSPWNNRLNATQISLQEFVGKAGKKYDCIVSNPPFFNNSAKSAQKEKALARHTDTLNFSDLISGVAKLLNPTGWFCVILPIDTENIFRQTALRYGLHLTKITRVKPNVNKPCKRVLLQFEFEVKNIVADQLIIETETRHAYTPEFIQKLKDFYLNL